MSFPVLSFPRRRAASSSLIALAALTLGLAGCGGNDGDSDPNPFAGEYPGVYSASTGDEGTIQVTIERSGRFDGSVTGGTGAIGAINGRLSNSGRFTGTVSSSDATANFDYAGNLTRRQDGVIIGTLSPTAGTTGPDVEIQLGVVQI